MNDFVSNIDAQVVTLKTNSYFWLELRGFDITYESLTLRSLAQAIAKIVELVRIDSSLAELLSEIFYRSWPRS